MIEYSVAHEDEVICTGTNRRELVKRARDALNKDNPPDEPVWTSKEVDNMVGVI